VTTLMFPQRYSRTVVFALSTAELESLLGNIADGTYSLNLLATNALGVSESTVVAFTLDRTGPELSLISPIVDGDHSPVVQSGGGCG
jgi:hypothetical protein